MVGDEKYNPLSAKITIIKIYCICESRKLLVVAWSARRGDEKPPEC